MVYYALLNIFVIIILKKDTQGKKTTRITIMRIKKWFLTMIIIFTYIIKLGFLGWNTSMGWLCHLNTPRINMKHNHEHNQNS